MDFSTPYQKTSVQKSLEGKSLNELISMLDSGIISGLDFVLSLPQATDIQTHLVSYCVKRGFLSVDQAKQLLGVD